MLSFDLIGKMEDDDIPDLLFTLDFVSLLKVAIQERKKSSKPKY
jgi:hypothetical protein